MSLSTSHLLGIEGLQSQDIERILKTAQSFREVASRPIKKVPALRGRSVFNLFLEPSTRTRSSFEIAAKRLSADAVNVSRSGSSVEKGETLVDTVQTLESMKPDVIVVRHPEAGAPHLAARRCRSSRIVNAGDGMHEHPTQALLDALTILDHKPQLAGLKVAIVGDIAHSRVARSNALLLSKMGAQVWVCGPPPLIPVDFEQYGGRVTFHMREAIADADVIMMLRVQRERQKEVLFPSVKEYFALYGLDEKKLKWARRSVIVMHPGPINRGVEIDPELADGRASVILDQVTNGVAVRMAVLFLLMGAGEESRS